MASLRRRRQFCKILQTMRMRAEGEGKQRGLLRVPIVLQLAAGNDELEAWRATGIPTGCMQKLVMDLSQPEKRFCLEFAARAAVDRRNPTQTQNRKQNAATTMLAGVNIGALTNYTHVFFNSNEKTKFLPPKKLM